MAPDDGYWRSGSDPFVPPVDQRDPARRLRGRLAAPVTVWTCYAEDRPQGITVSSILAAEGEPATVVGLLGPLSEFWEALQVSGRFVVHLLGAEHARVADQFALRYPGDPFEGLSTTASPHGPVLDGVTSRAACTLSDHSELGYSVMVRGSIDDVTLGPGDDPLVHYRGRYFTLATRSPRP